ncbi:hypothetical protein RAD16_10420 [Bradyrhizobium sp. 18BD]
MAVQRYDIRDPDGTFRERYWQPINSPIRDEDGRLVFLLHHVEDVTHQVEAERRSAERFARLATCRWCC